MTTGGEAPMTLKADASPTKAFFVRMLTRDITLDDCILDLVDNSIDSAWDSTGEHPSELKTDDALSNYYVEISTSPDLFRISDNCGGITLNDAVNYAFTFGRKEDQPPEEYTVGVYGIGMKRAVFKLGNDIRIISTYEENGSRVGFLVPINVGEWARESEGPWDFDLEDHAPADQTGVQIEVAGLSPEISRKFGDPSYEKNLRAVLARDYLLPIMRGLNVTVNGVQVKRTSLALKENADFVPMRQAYDDDGVRVEIFAGMADAPPNDTQPEATNRDTTSGWYVLCNGRAVLAADRSSSTGWGRPGWPQWHGQYNGFIGVVLFSAADPAKLPMTTTKRNVDTSSEVYVRALARMGRPTRDWIDYTNARKADLDRAAALEERGKAVPLAEIRPRGNVGLPPSRPRGEPWANVNYAVRRRRMLSLAKGFGDINMTYREVGTRSFDYAYERLVDEDES
jgi:hypothetical protein